MKIINIYSNDFNNLAQFHQMLMNKLDFPDYYGKNLDALWDMLTGWVDLPLTIVWNNFDACVLILGLDAIKIRNLFQSAEKDIAGFKVIINDHDISKKCSK